MTQLQTPVVRPIGRLLGATSLIALAVALAAPAVLAADPGAANFSLTASDGSNQNSFSGAPPTRWIPGNGTPASGFSYNTNGFLLRTGTDTLAPFAGAWLKLNSGLGLFSNNANNLAGKTTVGLLYVNGPLAYIQNSGGRTTQEFAGNVKFLNTGVLTLDPLLSGRTLNVSASMTDDDATVHGSVKVNTTAGAATNIGNVVYTTAKAYTGGTEVQNRGRLMMGVTDAMPTMGDLTVTKTSGAGGTFRLNGFDTKIQGLSGAGTVDNTNANAKTLTIRGNQAGVRQDFSGLIQNGTGGGALSLRMDGTSTTGQILSGANTFTGKTTIAGGTLEIRNAAALGAATPAGNTIIDESGAEAGTLALSNNISTAEQLTLVGRASGTTAHIENVSGNNTISGAVTLGDGASATDNFNIVSTAGTLTVSGPIATDFNWSSPRNLNLGGAGSGSIGNLTMTGGSTDTLNKSGAGTWTVNGTLTGVDEVNANQGTLKLGAGSDLSGVSEFSVAESAIIDASTVAAGFRRTTGQSLEGAGRCRVASSPRLGRSSISALMSLGISPR